MTDLPTPLRALLVTDAPWATSGYAVQAGLLAPRLAKHCHLAIVAGWGLHGAAQSYHGVPVLPGGNDQFANDVIGTRAAQWRADVVFTLKDLPVFRPEAFKSVRWCPLTPVDHEPMPPAVTYLARHAYAPIAYAPNGFRALRAAGMQPLYAPHAYDPAIFYRADRAEARRALGVPEEAFLVVTVAVNRLGRPSRKAWPELVEGFVRFARENDRALWAAHTHPGHDGYEGAVDLVTRLGTMRDRVSFPDIEQYKIGFPTDYLRTLYSAADVLLAPSLGEGFGVPVLEAQACGCPVIVGDWAATADLCFGGVKIGKDQAFAFDSAQDAYQYIPHPTAIAAALHEVANWSPERWQIASDAALRGAAAFAIDTVIEQHWVPLLNYLRDRISRERYGRGVQRIVMPAEVLR